MMNPVIAPNSKDLPFTLYESGAQSLPALLLLSACPCGNPHLPQTPRPISTFSCTGNS